LLKYNYATGPLTQMLLDSFATPCF